MANVDWVYCQQHAIEVLAASLSRLGESQIITSVTDVEPCAGVYVIYLGDEPYYIGEGLNLRARLRQQFQIETSTFYRNYSKKLSTLSHSRKLSISDFRCRSQHCLLGRKEIEEYGIVNLSTPLNKFHLRKQSKYDGPGNPQALDTIEAKTHELLRQGMDILMAQSTVNWGNATPPRTAGLYLVQNADGKIIYIGESSDISERFETHSGVTYFSALRRNLGTVTLGFALQTRNGKKRYFDTDEDKQVTDYLVECQVAFLPVTFGRRELEEHVIGKFSPMLNRKSK